MAAVVAEFFAITGIDMVPPETFAELIPYMIEIVVGVALVSAVFGVIGKYAQTIMDFLRWR